jgi:hypothetical protein
MANRRLIDLNSERIQNHTSTALSKELMDEFRQNYIRSAGGFYSLRQPTACYCRRIIREELHRLDNQDVFQVDKNIST